MIRRMVECDLEAVLDIERESFPDPWTRGNFADMLATPISRLYVLEEAGEVLGYVGGWRILDEVETANVAVRAASRGKGYGEALMRAMIDGEAREGAVRATLEVRVSNRAARSLYARLGFTLAGLRRGYYADGEDALILEKKL